MPHNAVWTTPTGSVVCDRSTCPAPAQRRLDIAGQDFYFCDHHAVEVAPQAELERAVRTPGARDPVLVVT